MTIFRIYDNDYDDRINFKEFSELVLFGKPANEIQIKNAVQKKDRNIYCSGRYILTFKMNIII